VYQMSRNYANSRRVLAVRRLTRFKQSAIVKT
jgi:hypothetical protein